MSERSKVGHWMITLERKKLVVRVKEDIFELTNEGMEVLEAIGRVKVVDDTPAVLTAGVIPTKLESINYKELHKELQDRLEELTGSKQAKGYSNAAFIPSVRDLETFLVTYRRVYKDNWDVVKIRACLLKHVDVCARTGVYTPVIKYYIYKEEKGSQLAADVEAFQENAEKQHKIKKTKDLFE